MATSRTRFKAYDYYKCKSSHKLAKWALVRTLTLLSGKYVAAFHVNWISSGILQGIPVPWHRPDYSQESDVVYMNVVDAYSPHLHL